MLIESSTATSPELLQLFREDILSSLHCALPARVLSWNESAQTVTVKPMGRKRVSAAGKTLAYPVLKDVPVFFPVIKMKELIYPCSCPYSGSSKHKIRLDIQPGDLCLVFFCDVNPDGWESGTAGSGAPRHHDLADAFALVGFHTQARLE